MSERIGVGNVCPSSRCSVARKTRGAHTGTTSDASALRDRSQPNHLFPKRRCFSPRLLLEVFFPHPLLEVFSPRRLLKLPAGPQALLNAHVQLLQSPSPLGIRGALAPMFVRKRVVRHGNPAPRAIPAHSQDFPGWMALLGLHGCFHCGIHGCHPWLFANSFPLTDDFA